ncbi:MAG: hypothetical protein HYZ48_01035, partial [Chlamydiales bacterium]|nr:hypothetical protein [Chlamydiales bacterium]
RQGLEKFVGTIRDTALEADEVADEGEELSDLAKDNNAARLAARGALAADFEPLMQGIANGTLDLAQVRERFAHFNPASQKSIKEKMSPLLLQEHMRRSDILQLNIDGAALPGLLPVICQRLQGEQTHLRALSQAAARVLEAAAGV